MLEHAGLGFLATWYVRMYFSLFFWSLGILHYPCNRGDREDERCIFGRGNHNRPAIKSRGEETKEMVKREKRYFGQRLFFFKWDTPPCKKTTK